MFGLVDKIKGAIVARKKSSAKKSSAINPWLAEETTDEKIDHLGAKVENLHYRLSKIEKSSVQNGVAQVCAIAAVGLTAVLGMHYGVAAGGVAAVVGALAAAVWQIVWYKNNKMFTLVRFKMFYQRTLKRQMIASKHESKPMTRLV